jgi:hypothetical protein
VLEWSEGRVLRTRALAQPLDDGPGKPVHIYDHVGLLPALAAGWVVVSMQRGFATVFDLAD